MAGGELPSRVTVGAVRRGQAAGMGREGRRRGQAPWLCLPGRHSITWTRVNGPWHTHVRNGLDPYPDCAACSRWHHFRCDHGQYKLYQTFTKFPALNVHPASSVLNESGNKVTSLFNTRVKDK